MALCLCFSVVEHKRNQHRADLVEEILDGLFGVGEEQGGRVFIDPLLWQKPRIARVEEPLTDKGNDSAVGFRSDQPARRLGGPLIILNSV